MSARRVFRDTLNLSQQSNDNSQSSAIFYDTSTQRYFVPPSPSPDPSTQANIQTFDFSAFLENHVIEIETPMKIFYTDSKSQKQYKRLSKIGSGRFGDVYKVQCMRSFKKRKLNGNHPQTTNAAKKETLPNAVYALKCQEIFQGQIGHKLEKELSLMHKLQSDHNVIHIFDHFIDEGQVGYDQCMQSFCMILPFYETDLEVLLQEKRNGMDEKNAMSVPNLNIVQSIMKQMLNGLLYIHKQLNIIHRDIKPNNILIENYGQSNMNVVITDFGSAREMPEKVTCVDTNKSNSNTNVCSDEKNEDMVDIKVDDEDIDISADDSTVHTSNFGGSGRPNIPLLPTDKILANENTSVDNGRSSDELTPQVYIVMYRAPELLLGDKQYTFAIDIWAVGCIFAQMCREKSKALMNEDKDIPQLFEMFDVLGGPPVNALAGIGVYGKFFGVPEKDAFLMRDIMGEEYLNDSGCDLLQHLMKYNPKERFSAEQALQHPFFNE